jgi:tRNA pseudouridine32 synthase/23S rRNA pseudouridine746 synthase
LSTQTDSEDLYFNPLNSSSELPERFNLMKDGEPHPLCVDAAKQLKLYLSTQKDWEHNFGLKPKQKGRIIGKMFGVLVVQNSKKQIGYLAAFSGKLAGGNHHPKFVPPVFDSLQENSFLNNGMAELKCLNEEILKDI